MRRLATLETTEDAQQVEACLLALEALTKKEAVGTHFHPRVLRALYAQFTAVYKRGAATLESHQDSGQAGRIEHYALCQTGALALPEKFKLEVAKPFHRQAQGQTQRSPEKNGQRPSSWKRKRPVREGWPQTQASEEALPDLRPAEDVLAECFALDPLEVARAKGETVSSDAVSNPNTGAPGTPPEVAARFAILMEEGVLPLTTLEQRRRNPLTRGTRYGAPQA